MSAPLTVKQVLQDALALVRGGWTRGRSKKMRYGRACYCISGAVHATTDDGALRSRAWSTLALSLPSEHWSPIRFNDAPGRKKSEVIALFERAIARA